MEPRSHNLERSILSTLAYFDVFEYPLEVPEIWRWLYVSDPADVTAASPHDVEQAVRRLEGRGAVERVGPMVVLPGRSGHVATRLERKAAGQRLWRRARFASSVLRLVPFVRFIGVVNTLAIDNARPDSDIDFFIIVQRGRLWLTRMSVTVLTYLLGIRRHGRKVAQRICLSFFMSDRELSLESMKFEPEDPYLAFWTTSIVPMFDRADTWSRFMAANRWVDARLPNGRSILPAPYHADAWLPGMIRSLIEWPLDSAIGDAAERASHRLQTWKMRWPSIDDAARGESGTVISDDILKFHERDRRRQYRAAFFARRAEVL
ncbi:MAG: hypothetical protein HY976_00170 [Candidatus Kerfeldbacteria bacterium]|nr:hypothetical protein [Candidatus Kerfeldbacteria bacterium]